MSARLEAPQELVEPGEGGDVEVVGRLVEQQQVGILQEQPRQRGAHLPAAGEGRAGLLQLGQREAEPGQQPFGAVAAEPLVEVVELLVQVGQRRRELQLGLAVGGRAQPVLGRRQPLLQRGSPRHRRQHRLDHRAGRERGHVLRQVADAGAAPPGERAGVGRHLACQDAEQGRLAGAVGAEQADPVVRADREAGAVEEDLGPVGQGKTADDEEAHRQRSVARPGAAGKAGAGRRGENGYG